MHRLVRSKKAANDSDGEEQAKGDEDGQRRTEV